MIRSESPASDPLFGFQATDPTLRTSDTDRVHLLGTLVGPDGSVAFLRGDNGRIEQVAPGDLFGTGVVAEINEGSILFDEDGTFQTVFLDDRIGS